MIKISKILKPNNTKELIDILSKEEKVYFLAGGTDLLIRAKDELLEDRTWVDIGDIQELRNISVEGNNVIIGSAVTHSEIIKSPVIQEYFTGLAQAVKTIGSVQIRNTATIGGNVANASPAGDSIPMLMVFDANIITLFDGNIFNYPISKFFTGPGKTQMRNKELVLNITLPITTGYEQKFLKLGQREGIAISKLNVAVNYQIEDKIISDIKIALGAVAPTVVRAYQTEKHLQHKKISQSLIDKAVELIQTECSPITDIRSTLEYRKKVIGNLLHQFFIDIK